MQYRKDKHGNDLSILGYGCMRFTKKGNSIDLDKAEKEIMAAFKAGVNYYDTAYIYPGSEVAVGEIFEKNGIRVGMTGYCFPYKDGKKDISADVRKLREAGCQIVIASFHWGSEYREDFTGEQRNIGRAAIRAGAG